MRSNSESLRRARSTPVTSAPRALLSLDISMDALLRRRSGIVNPSVTAVGFASRLLRLDPGALDDLRPLPNLGTHRGGKRLGGTADGLQSDRAQLFDDIVRLQRLHETR